MVESADLQNMLQTGRWATSQSRAKTPQPPEAMPTPVRANQSSKLDRQVPRSFDLLSRYPPPPSVEDEAQSLAKELGGSVSSVVSADEEPKNRGELEQYPILKAANGDDDDYDDDDDDDRVKRDAEWRFVHVGSMPSAADDATDRSGKTKPGKEEYEANTCRKFTMPLRPGDKQGDRHGDQPADKQPEKQTAKRAVSPTDRHSDRQSNKHSGKLEEEEQIKNRRRRSDLPRIETDINTSLPSQRSARTAAGAPTQRTARSPSRERRRSQSRGPSRDPSRLSTPLIHRTRSSTLIEQQPRDYFDKQESRGPPGDGFLSPTPSVIKHSTRGRDRAYVDFNPSGAGGDSCRRSTVSSRPPDDHNERRSAVGYDRHRYPSETSVHRRSASAVELPKPSRRPSERDRRPEAKQYYNEPLSARSSRRNLSPQPERRSGSPARPERRSSPPSRRYSQREKPSRGDSGYRSQRSPAPSRPPSDYSSDEYSGTSRRSARPREGRERPKSFIGSTEQNYLLSPDAGRPPMNGRMGSSRRSTPLPSPRTSAAGLESSSALPSPRSSATFLPAADGRRGDEGPPSPFSPGPSPSPTKTYLKELPPTPLRDRETARRPESRAHSRMPSLTTSFSAAAAGAAAAAGGAAVSATVKSPMSKRDEEVLHDRQRTVGHPSAPPVARQDSIGSDGSVNNRQQPALPSPQTGEDRDVALARRDSDRMEQPRTPDLPDCSRRIPQTGFADWLTLPLAPNFNVCPSCYSGVFANTEFAHSFVLAPYRQADRPIACDLGTSFWYRMAWLITWKSRLPNLQLLQNLAVGASKHQACTGDRVATRVWCTVRNPESGRPVEDFTVCLYCAGAVQALFPNLAGTFHPLNAKSEPTRSVCSLHFAPGRERFFDYFEVFEEASDHALARGSAPDVRRLYDRLRRVGESDCPRDKEVTNHEWYIMRGVPEMTVCKGCFDDAVVPELDRENPVATQFLPHPQFFRAPRTCQLYSDRMRRVFAEACRANNIAWLAQRVTERVAAEIECKNKIEKYEALNASSGGAYQNKVHYYQRRWERHE